MSEEAVGPEQSKRWWWLWPPKNWSLVFVALPMSRRLWSAGKNYGGDTCGGDAGCGGGSGCGGGDELRNVVDSSRRDSTLVQ